jgi:hypothetical protein
MLKFIYPLQTENNDRYDYIRYITDNNAKKVIKINHYVFASRKKAKIEMVINEVKEVFYIEKKIMDSKYYFLNKEKERIGSLKIQRRKSLLRRTFTSIDYKNKISLKLKEDSISIPMGYSNTLSLNNINIPNSRYNVTDVLNNKLAVFTFSIFGFALLNKKISRKNEIHILLCFIALYLREPK